jgi:hypothetical protein
MAYQKCINDVISILKDKYPNNIWNKSEEDSLIRFSVLFEHIGKQVLLQDEEILIRLHNEVYKGLTIVGYKVPLMDIDIDPNFRQFNEYDKDYDECEIELENNQFKFNLT